MIIPQAQQLRSEDYDKTVQGWIGRLLGPLNTFMSSVAAAINGRLSFQDNFLGQQNTVTFTYSANTLPIKFAQTFSGTPLALEVVKATESSQPVIVLAAWQASNKVIQLTDLAKVSNGVVSALTAGASYTLTVRVSE